MHAQEEGKLAQNCSNDSHLFFPFSEPTIFNVYAKLFALGVSSCTQLQSSGLVAHENSTFRNLALAVSGPLME